MQEQVEVQSSAKENWNIFIGPNHHNSTFFFNKQSFEKLAGIK